MDKIAIYYRVSTDTQDLESQRFSVNRWLNNLKSMPPVILTFEDEGISGKTVRRPGLQAMLRAAYKGKVDTIVVYRLDRLSRNASTAIRMILDLDDVGVAFISISQPVLNLGHENPFRRTMLAAFAEIAEIERETISARVKAGLSAARKRGVKLGPPRKITDAAILESRRMRQEGQTIRHIAAKMQLSVGSISKMLRSDETLLKVPSDTSDSSLTKNHRQASLLVKADHLADHVDSVAGIDETAAKPIVNHNQTTDSCEAS